MALELTVKIAVTPSAGQSQEEAEDKFAVLFREYLTEPGAPFLTDYGAEAWGGYDGPYVSSVDVQRVAQDGEQ